MIVWGGTGDFSFRRFEHAVAGTIQANNSWTATNTYNTPEPRSSHTAVWTGSEMIVWGGLGQMFSYHTEQRRKVQSCYRQLERNQCR